MANIQENKTAISPIVWNRYIILVGNNYAEVFQRVFGATATEKLWGTIICLGVGEWKLTRSSPYRLSKVADKTPVHWSLPSAWAPNYLNYTDMRIIED